MPRSPDHRLSRRRLLTAAGATALAAGSAGCTGGLPPLGQRARYGRVDPPAGSDPDFRRWIPAQSAVPDAVDETGGTEFHTSPRRLADVFGHRLPIPEIMHAVLKSRLDYFGLPFDRIDGATLTDLGVAIDAEVDRSTATEAILDSGYDRAGAYEGYDLFDRSDAPRAFGVGDDWIVFTKREPLAAAVEALIDTGHGRRTRRHEVDDAFAELTDRAGGGPFVLLSDWLTRSTGSRTDDASNPEASATVVRIGEDGVYYLGPNYFPDGPPPVDELRERVDHWRTDANVDLTEVSVDGDWATIEMLLTPDSLAQRRERASSEPRVTPLITWGVDVGAETVTIRHEAGGSLPADTLSVSISGDADSVEMHSDGDEFGPGDAFTVDRSSLEETDSPLRVVYSVGDRSTTLFQYELPESGRDEHASPDGG